MATALSIGAASGAAPPVHRFTVDEFHEVADTALPSDREFKAPLYARHGVPEYWIVNLVDRQVEIFRAPSEGQYVIRLTASGDDTIAASALPAAWIPVASIW